MRVITRLNVGGAARHAIELARGLPPAFDVHLYAGLLDTSEAPLTDTADVDVLPLPLVRPIRPIWDARAVRDTRRAIRLLRPDIVHSHTAKAGLVARLAAATLYPRPITVHTFHGHVLDGYFSRIVSRAILAVERALAKRTTALVAISPSIRDELLNRGIGVPAQWHVIPLGLDLSTLLRQDSDGRALRDLVGVSASTPLLGIVARLAPVKDHSLLLRAMCLVPEAHLAVVGDGELRSTLEDEAKELGITHRVHFLGWRSDLTEVYAACDLTLLTSRNEGTPVSLIESMACGVPFVSTDVGGARDVLPPGGGGGVLVPNRTPEAIAEAIQDVLSWSSAERSRSRVVSQSHVKARYALDRLLTDVEILYHGLLDEQAKRRE